MKRKILVAGVVLAIAAAGTYAFTKGFDLQRFMESLRKVNPWGLTASIVVSVATSLGLADRWRLLGRPVKAVAIRPLFEATLVGFSVIYILGRAGELARPVWLMRREKVPFSASVATLVAERFLDMISLIGVFAWALLTVEVPAESAQT